jgi:hypothetical protein
MRCAALLGCLALAASVAAGHETVSAADTRGNIESERLYADENSPREPGGLSLVAVGQDREARRPRARADWERRPAPGRASIDRTLLLGLDYTW